MNSSTHAIRSRPHTYYAGKTPQGDQILMGWLAEVIVVFRFDRAGTLLDVEEHPISLNAGRLLNAEETANRYIQELKHAITFHEDVIHVKPFFNERLAAGIRQFPSDLEDYINDPDTFSEEDLSIFQKDIEDWKAAGNCVLFWGNDYDIDNEGYTI